LAPRGPVAARTGNYGRNCAGWSRAAARRCLQCGDGHGDATIRHATACGRRIGRGGPSVLEHPHLALDPPLLPARRDGILVIMTRKAPVVAEPAAQSVRSRWSLQDAKARFSELVRMAHRDGPQHVTLHGRDAVVVVDADEFTRLKGEQTGELLIEALQASPHRQVEIEPGRSAMPVRAVKL
jgi:prevent-host-death family protein